MEKQRRLVNITYVSLLRFVLTPCPSLREIVNLAICEYTLKTRMQAPEAPSRSLYLNSAKVRQGVTPTLQNIDSKAYDIVTIKFDRSTAK